MIFSVRTGKTRKLLTFLINDPTGAHVNTQKCQKLTIIDQVGARDWNNRYLPEDDVGLTVGLGTKRLRTVIISLFCHKLQAHSPQGLFVISP